jgi:hypothetical protein
LLKLQSRPNGSNETSTKKGLYRRLVLRRADGRIYLHRWGLSIDRIGGIYLHRMDAPDPGIDMHSHPWAWVGIILKGGYQELRSTENNPEESTWTTRHPGSIKSMGLNEIHTITGLLKKNSWSLVIKGPYRRAWGFFTPDGFMVDKEYDATVRAGRRDLWAETR